MTLSALPSVFGEKAALHINHRQNITYASDIQSFFNNHNIQISSITQTGTQTVITLDNPEQQLEAQALLKEQLDSSNTVALAMEPAAPQWLLKAGFSPITLGLDLRGGVQFLLDVDMEPVYQAHRQMAVDEITKAVGAGRARIQDETVQITLPRSQDMLKARSLLRTQFAQWDSRVRDNMITLSLPDSEKSTLRNLTLSQNIQILRSRIGELGITEAVVQRQGENRIRIELPGVQDPAAAKDVIGATSSLAFHAMSNGNIRQTLTVPDQNGHPVQLARRAILDGEHIIDARAGIGDMGSPEVNISLDANGGRKMSDFTRSNIGQPMATLYSEYSQDENGATQQSSEVISIATIQSPLGNRFRITGVGSMQDAQELALLLRAGSLTAPISIVEERTIGPTLGAENVKNGFAALALGLGLTLVFISIWYRKLGLVANLALLANMVCLFGLIALLPGAVLTLPGIAGMVLTVGMAVDTNVLIFERIRDMMREGRSFAQSIDRGFQSAFSSIFDANLTTMIVAIALYTLGNGPIQGFAVTLGLGLLTSMFTGIFLSRALINLIWGQDKRRDVRV